MAPFLLSRAAIDPMHRHWNGELPFLTPAQEGV